MFTPSKRLKTQVLACFIIGLAAISISHGQSVDLQSAALAEKVYLHTDRSNYVVGENLWYKAYSVAAQTNVLLDRSKLLYVELLSPESKIIQRNITRLDSGLGHGDFILVDSLGVKPGRYQLRAYTNWSRNFGDAFIFKKEIDIISDNYTATASEPTNGDELEKGKKNNQDTAIDIQFFPEGGSLLEDVSSLVAFKAIDRYGYPIAVKGEVFAADGTAVAIFKSKHDGMGAFVITPQKGETYSAAITTVTDEKSTVILPQALEYGYVLSATNNKEKKIITIKTNQQTLDKNPEKPLTLEASVRGVSYFEGTEILRSKLSAFILPPNSFPEGIAQVTLYDGDRKPQSERLVYIENEKDFTVTVVTDKKQYLPKEKVTVSVDANTNDGKPLLASFSVSALESKAHTANTMNISSYFLMEADIKGKVHNPGHYFDVNNPSRKQDLDLLLLTQGWRDFLWKKGSELKEGNSYKTEKIISVSGRVHDGIGGTAKRLYTVSMALTNNGKLIMTNTVTDANGGYRFDDISFLGEASLLLNTQNDKGKNKGKLILYDIYREPIPVDFSPSIGASFNKERLQIFKEEIFKKNILFNVPSKNMLDEVIVTANKVEQKPASIGRADYVKVMDEKTNRFSSMQHLIQFSLPGVIVSGQSIGFNRFSGPALILLDGVEMDAAGLDGISTDDVDRIEGITSAGTVVYGTRGGNGVILIYTKEGTIQNQVRTAAFTISEEIQGFYNARVFYAPNYEDNLASKDSEPDIRNTLYWNPYVHPNETGNNQFSFYNSEVSTDVNVLLEGITVTGIPVVVNAAYSIER
ncbi:hypothetical protein MWU65_17140 [Cellulophaga sp. F20128]|uniref:hypothetical protein n=1 Tax=Cellulophaga sp. F20128 TaxID=2926413 RepID=UPI001FF1CCAE|nr:hypothetical protein [Cellulophaga sp. F20128]MCK0158916.1 hypothetical protein [Cellulophaga sp. F20128]